MCKNVRNRPQIDAGSSERAMAISGRGSWHFCYPPSRHVYSCNVRARSGSGQKPRFSDGRAHEEAATDAQDRSHIAIARGRSGSCPQGGRNDARGRRRENVDYSERRVASGERRVHPSNAKHYRETCGRGGCRGRDPRADMAVAFSSSSEARRKIAPPLQDGSRRTTGRAQLLLPRPNRTLDSQ